MAAPLASLAELQTFMQSDEIDADQANLILAIASQTIRTFVGQMITAVDGDEMVLDAGYATELWLPERPVTSVDEITVDGNVVPTASYRWTSAGRLRFSAYLAGWGGASAFAPQATVIYSHGYTVVPDDIKGVCLNLAQRAITTPDAGVVASETIGIYSITYSRQAASTLLVGDEQRLRPYRPTITGVPIVAGGA